MAAVRAMPIAITLHKSLRREPSIAVRVCARVHFDPAGPRAIGIFVDHGFSFSPRFRPLALTRKRLHGERRSFGGV